MYLFACSKFQLYIIILKITRSYVDLLPAPGLLYWMKDYLEVRNNHMKSQNNSGVLYTGTSQEKSWPAQWTPDRRF